MRIHARAVDEENDIARGDLDPFFHADFAIYWDPQDVIEGWAMNAVPIVGVFEGDGAHVDEKIEGIGEVSNDGDDAKDE